MNNPSADPVADMLLDFQAVMAQFLELQTSVMGALANRHRQPRVAQHALAAAAGAAPVAVSARTSQAVPEPPPPAAPAGPVVEVTEGIAAPIDQAAFSRYTLTVRDRPF